MAAPPTSDPLLGAVTVREPARRPAELLSAPRSGYEALAQLLGWGTLVNILFVEAERSIWLVPIVLGAALVVLRPSAVLGVSGILLGMAGRTLAEFDPPPDLWVFLAVLALAWIFVVPRAAMRHGGWPRMSEVGPGLASSFRGAFVVGWALVLLHQLNDSFLDVAVSCSVHVYERSRDLLVFLPDLGPRPSERLPVAVLVVETVIVLGLAVPWLRRLPVAVALLFLTVVGAADPTLAALALPFLVLFVPVDVVDTALDRLSSLDHRRPIIADALALAVAGVVVLALIRTGAAVLADSDFLVAGDLGVGPPLARLLMVVTGLGLFVLYGVGTFGPPPLTESEEPMEWFGPASALLTLIVLGLGLAPYLGLGTAHALADGSNLRTEGERWNHLFLPDEMTVVDTQTPVIRVFDRDHPAFADLGRHLDQPVSRVLVTEHEARRRVADACADGPLPPLTLARDDVVSLVRDPCADPSLASSEGFLLDWFVAHRPVADGGRCLLPT